MMGFFSNLFAKQNCAVCGKECGTLHRSKLRDGQFLCDDCGNKCSKYIRLSELTLDEAKEHMEYMARMKRVFDEVFDKTEFRVNAYPSTPTQMGLVFCDELGMLYIDDRTGGRGKMPELIRYDQIASYEEYLDETPSKEPGQKPTLNGGGLKIRLVQPRGITEAETRRGLQPHPYIKQELVICFSKRDRREIGYAHIARQHLDHIFGVHDNETSMFGRRMSKAEERELKGQMGMIGAMGAVASAAMKGGQLSEQEKARFVENINLANDAQTAAWQCTAAVLTKPLQKCSDPKRRNGYEKNPAQRFPQGHGPCHRRPRADRLRRLRCRQRIQRFQCTGFQQQCPVRFGTAGNCRGQSRPCRGPCDPVPDRGTEDRRLYL